MDVNKQVMFGDPFYYHIINELNCESLYNLSNTCKLYQTTLMKQIINCAIMSVNHLLNDIFGNNKEAFKQFIRDTNSIITGLSLSDYIMDDFISDNIVISVHTSQINIDTFKSTRFDSLLQSSFGTNYTTTNKYDMILIKYLDCKIFIHSINTFNNVNRVLNSFNKNCNTNIHKTAYYFDNNKETIQLHSDVLTNNTTFCPEQPTTYHRAIQKTFSLTKRNIGVELPSYKVHYNNLYHQKDIDYYTTKYISTDLNCKSFDKFPFGVHREKADDEDQKDNVIICKNSIQTLKCTGGLYCPESTVDTQNGFHIHHENMVLRFHGEGEYEHKQATETTIRFRYHFAIFVFLVIVYYVMRWCIS